MNKIRNELSTALVKVLRRVVVPILSEIVTSRFLLAEFPEITLEYFTNLERYLSLSSTWFY